MKTFCFCCLLACLSVQSFAQSFPLLEQNPSRLRWRQLRTPHFRVIYPHGFDGEAQRTANLLQAIYEPVSQTLGRKPRAISIILQNQTTISNGFVTMLPRRSEFYASAPPQDATLSGTNEWVGQLAVHEFRHVVQYDKVLTGLSKGAYWLFGNNALALIGGVTVPNWFWEGDAVGTETALTSGGRGRVPRFDLEFRTRLLTGGAFRYAKAYGRSYKDLVPNHYVLGYFMTSHLRRHHDADAWGKILTRHYNFPIEPFSFSGAIRKETGLKVEELYAETTKELAGLWRNQLNQLNETSATILATAKNRVQTNYEFPQYLDNETIICRKSGLADIETYVTLKKQAGLGFSKDTIFKLEGSRKPDSETRIFTPGTTEFNSSTNNPNNGMLSVAAGKIVWGEHHFDPRWGLRDYLVVKIYDVKTKKLRQLTHRSRLFAPSLSPDGKTVVAVEVTQENLCRLRFLDEQTGQVSSEIKTFRLENGGVLPEKNILFQMPRFSPDGKNLVAVSLDGSGKNLDVFDLQTLTVKRFPFGDENISHPVMHGDHVFYNSPFTGIDNIYALHLPTGRKFQITSRKFGAYNAAVSPDGNELAFNDFTPGGFRIATMPNDSIQWIPLENLPNRNVSYYRPLMMQEGGKNVLKMAGSQQYTAKPFRRAANLINPYSWGPVLNSTGSELFVGLVSQDLLSTLAVQTGYSYDANQRTGSYSANASYQGWYPVLDLDVSSSERQTSLYIDRRQPLDSLRNDRWRENRISGGFRLPFTLTHSRFRESLVFSSYASMTQVSDYNLPVRRFTDVGNGSLYDIRYRLQYSRLHKQANRDVFPKWGQQLTLSYRHTPLGGDYSGGQAVAQAGFFVPGLLKHHGLLLRGTYKWEDAGSNYRFAAPIQFVRGGAYTTSRNYVGASADYRLPIVNTDWILGRWLYIQRLKGNFFADWANLSDNGDYTNATSVGFDLSANFNVMRLLPQFEIGVRAIYFPQTQTYKIQPLVIDVGF